MPINTDIDANMKGASYALKFYVSAEAAKRLHEADIGVSETCLVSGETYDHDTSFGEICKIKDPFELEAALESVANQCSGIASLKIGNTLVVMEGDEESLENDQRAVMRAFKNHGLNPKDGRKLYDTFGSAAVGIAEMICQTSHIGNPGFRLQDPIYNNTRTEYHVFSQTQEGKARADSAIHQGKGYETPFDDWESPVSRGWTEGKESKWIEGSGEYTFTPFSSLSEDERRELVSVLDHHGAEPVLTDSGMHFDGEVGGLDNCVAAFELMHGISELHEDEREPDFEAHIDA